MGLCVCLLVFVVVVVVFGGSAVNFAMPNGLLVVGAKERARTC